MLLFEIRQKISNSDIRGYDLYAERNGGNEFYLTEFFFISCDDIDECALKTDDCHRNAICSITDLNIEKSSKYPNENSLQNKLQLV